MPWLTGNSIPEDEFCRVIRVPNDPVFIHAISGALLELTYAGNWEQQGTLTPEQQAAAFDDVYVAFTQSECIEASDLIYPKSFLAFGNVFKMVGAGALQTIFLANTMHGQYTRVVTPYNGQEYEAEILMAAGNWKINYVAISNNSSGIVRLRVDQADTIFVNDYYSAVQTLNLISNNTQTVAIATDGNHKIGFQNEGKNASSSNYNFWLQAVWGTWESSI